MTLSTPEVAIGENAKVCYATSGDKDITKSLVHGSGHLAVLRFAYATFNVQGISTACHTQIVRSSHLDFLVESKRYVSFKKGGFEFVYPEDLSAEAVAIMKEHWGDTVRRYQALLDAGVTKEKARAILPVNTSTKMNITGNLQGWWSALELRVSKHAQDEIRKVYIRIWIELSKAYPNVFPAELKMNDFTLSEWMEKENITDEG